MEFGSSFWKHLLVGTLCFLCTFLPRNGGSLIQLYQSMPPYSMLLAAGAFVLASVSHCLIFRSCPTEFTNKLLSCAVYRLKFHPLAKYPGPWFGAVTDWYTVYHCVMEDRHIDFYKLHTRYGMVKSLKMISYYLRGWYAEIVQDQSFASVQIAYL